MFADIPWGCALAAAMLVAFMVSWLFRALLRFKWDRDEARQEALKAELAKKYRARKDKWEAEKAIQIKLNEEAAERRYQQGLKDDMAFLMGQAASGNPPKVCQEVFGGGFGTLSMVTPFPKTAPVRDTWRTSPSGPVSHVGSGYRPSSYHTDQSPVHRSDDITGFMLTAALLDTPQDTGYAPPMYDSSVSDSCSSYSDTSSDSSSDSSSSCSSSDSSSSSD